MNSHVGTKKSTGGHRTLRELCSNGASLGGRTCRQKIRKNGKGKRENEEAGRGEDVGLT